jgi:hypothetical protein
MNVHHARSRIRDLESHADVFERQAMFIADFYRDLIEWCEQTITEIEQWPDTRDVGLTPTGRERSRGYSPSRIPRPFAARTHC